MRNELQLQIESTIPAGFTLDYVSGNKIKETKKESVRQRVVRALIHEYGFFPDDMALDYSVGGRKKIDIAIFHHERDHTVDNLSRAVICCPEPNIGKKAVRIREFEQAAKDLEGIETIMQDIESITFGLWTNGLDFFYIQKEQTRFETVCVPISDWPMAEESLGTKDVLSIAHTRIADHEMLKITFKRCHNFIHGNEGMPKDAAFWQFLYLIFCKMHDEGLRSNQRHSWKPRFWAGAKEQFTVEGQKEISKRITSLFSDAKKEYGAIFRGNEEITLSNRALAFIVSELAKYDFTRTDVDAKGVAYQELVGVNLRGDRGQYFTPRGVVKLVIEMLDPKEDERLLDPSCGTGGFLVATLGYMLAKFCKEQNTVAGAENTQGFFNVNKLLREYAASMVIGADFDQFLVRAAQMNMVLAGDGRGHIYHLNSLEFPQGHMKDVSLARNEVDFGTVDIIATNPPFGSNIPITDKHILEKYDLAHNWDPDGEGGFRKGKIKGSVSPEILFIERCIKWLKPGTGRMGIVLPNGVLGNPASEYIRWWIMKETRVLASVDLPIEAFIAEANVNILTSLLFLRRKSEQEKLYEAMSGMTEYAVFMAVADKIGYDRRGNKLFKRTPDGEEIITSVEVTEKFRIGGKIVERVLKRNEKIEDNDLPVIAEKYREFRKEQET